jgi:uncharacterized protein DUF3261
VPRASLAAALLAAGLGAGCALLGRGRAVPECPGELVASEAIAGEFLLRQRWSVSRGDETFSLEVVAQKRGDELVLVGLHPLGAKLFTLRQRGLETRVEAAPAPALEVPPLDLLRDLHRARFLAVAGAGADGRFAERRGDIEISEWREGGRLRERRFRRLADDRLVTLRFDAPAPDAGRAARLEIDNAWCGYRAEVTTLSEQALP